MLRAYVAIPCLFSCLLYYLDQVADSIVACINYNREYPFSDHFQLSKEYSGGYSTVQCMQLLRGNNSLPVPSDVPSSSCY